MSRHNSNDDHYRSDPPEGRSWRYKIRKRLLVAAIVFGLWAVGIQARLVYLQVFQHAELVAHADRQQNRSITSHPKRGEILDRNSRVLAYSVDANTIYAVPTEIDNPEETALKLCNALDECSSKLRDVIETRLRKPRLFEYVQRQVSQSAARRVEALELVGVGFLKENRRYYPNKNLAAHLLGYVGIDNQGLSGIEFTYDSEISGRPGKTLIQIDARRLAFSRIERPPTAGATIELTIDKYLQHIAERELLLAVQEQGADSGTVIVFEPNTGEVLALANQPSFNPNTFTESSELARRNRAVQDAYEPGSTFKIVTASAALEERMVVREELFDVSAGAIKVGGSLATDMHTYDVLSFEDVIVKSSNVGAIKVGLRLGSERLSRYVRRFGFGQTLSRDFHGESSGIVGNPADLDERGLASLAMGYQVAVTPLQMVTAASAVANGGELLEPKIVRAVVRDGIRVETPRRVIRRVISEETASELTSIMEHVVNRGTARGAQISGYTVAGKTGTTEKLIDGQYSDIDHYASFVGFVPSQEPVLSILVIIDTPRGGQYTGGAVAAPIFKRIAEASLRHLAVPPTVNPISPMLVLQSTKPRESTVLISSQDVDYDGGLMPDLRGMSARKAIDTLGPFGLSLSLKGSGFVVSQKPDPGIAISQVVEASLSLERKPVMIKDTN